MTTAYRELSGRWAAGLLAQGPRIPARVAPCRVCQQRHQEEEPAIRAEMERRLIARGWLDPKGLT